MESNNVVASTSSTKTKRCVIKYTVYVFFSGSLLQEYPSRKLRLIEDSNAANVLKHHHRHHHVPPTRLMLRSFHLVSIRPFHYLTALVVVGWCFFSSSFILSRQKRLKWCAVSFFMVSTNSRSSSVIIIINYSRRQCHLTHKICYCCSYGRDGQKRSHSV